MTRYDAVVIGRDGVLSAVPLLVIGLLFLGRAL